MSSSRIIKSSSETGHGSDFFLEEFEGVERQAFISEDETFQPLFAEFMPKPVVVEAPPPQPVIDVEALLAGMISEEEAQLRIDEAYDSGFAESRRQFEMDLAIVSRAFGAAVAEINGLRDLLFKESEDDLLRLAIKLAERIIRQEITLDRSILAKNVADVVGHLTDHEGFILSFNPEDYRIIVENGYLAHTGIADMKRIDVKPDENVTLGGCLVETASGQVDGQIEAQLSELFNQLMEERVSLSGEAEDEQVETDLSQGTE